MLFNFIVSCVIIPTAGEGGNVILRKIFDWGKFSVNTRQLYFHCRVPGAWPRQRNTLSEEFMEIATDWIKCGYNCQWQAVASPPKLKMKMKPDAQTNTLLPTNVQQMHFTCRDISLLRPAWVYHAVEIARRRFALEMWWKWGSGNSEWQHVL